MATTSPILFILFMLGTLISLITLLHSVTAAPLTGRGWKGTQATTDSIVRSPNGPMGDSTVNGDACNLLFAATSSSDMAHSAAIIDCSTASSGSTYLQYFPLPSLAVPYSSPTPLRTGLDVEFRRRRSTSPNTSVPSSIDTSSEARDTCTTPQMLGGPGEQPIVIVPRDGLDEGNRTEVEIAVATTKATAATSTVAAELGSATDITTELATPADLMPENADSQLAQDIQSVVQRILQLCVQILFDNAAAVGFLIALCTVLYMCGLRLRWKAQEQQDAV